MSEVFVVMEIVETVEGNYYKAPVQAFVTHEEASEFCRTKANRFDFDIVPVPVAKVS